MYAESVPGDFFKTKKSPFLKILFQLFNPDLPVLDPGAVVLQTDVALSVFKTRMRAFHIHVVDEIGLDDPVTVQVNRNMRAVTDDHHFLPLVSRFAVPRRRRYHAVNTAGVLSCIQF